MYGINPRLLGDDQEAFAKELAGPARMRRAEHEIRRVRGFGAVTLLPGGKKV